MPAVPSFSVLGTPLAAVDYAGLVALLQERVRGEGAFAVEFANTHTVTLSRHDPEFRRRMEAFDLVVPDGMPLIWCLNARGAGLADRVYGPTFFRRCLEASPAPFRHYFLGGSPECQRELRRRMSALQPGLQVVGGFDGIVPDALTPDLAREIEACRPDFIWVALGAPRQEAWIARHKAFFTRGVLLSVGFAFDANAGTKDDAPAWMQRRGLTWLFRLAREPRRLAGRYIQYNALFLFYLLRDALLPPRR